jgi:hypothetical protein
MLISTIGHDPAAVFIPELGQWVYEDPTFNEEYFLDGTGNPLSPEGLLALSTAGQAGRLQARKFAGPSHDPEVYIPDVTYVGQHPDGMLIMGSQLNSSVVGVGGWSTKLVQIDVPQLEFEWPYGESASYSRVDSEIAFPSLGVVVQEVESQDSVFVAHLASTFPGHARFERRLSGGLWEDVPAVNTLPVGACVVEYRSLDTLGNASAIAELNVWAPRSKDFLQLGERRQEATFCVSTGGM